MKATYSFGVGLIAMYLTFGSGCVYFSKANAVTPSYLTSPNRTTAIAELMGGDPLELKRSLLIQDPHLALTSRIELIEAAANSIDIQYFIWKNDSSGIFVIESLLAAADRGVRVRVLVDDIELEGLIDRIAALNDHPNIEIRIFNPFSVRQNMRLRILRLIEFAIDGNRLNHRMHNKLMIADKQLAILGGRNIGDEYFGQGKRRNFIDTDIHLSGGIVPELSEGFDAYWNSQLAHPVGKLFRLYLTKVDLGVIRDRIDRRLSERPDLLELVNRIPEKELFEALVEGHEYSEFDSIIDEPTVGWFENADESAKALTDLAISATSEVLIVSPYLIPTPKLLGIADTLIAKGVKIKVLTNSLLSNDVVLAQAAYSRFRKDILKSGVELYEMMGNPAMTAGDSAPSSGLHSKFIIFDRRIVFIGSMNLDPRSLYLNTELGVALQSEALSDELRTLFTQMIQPDNAWKLENTPDGIRWRSSTGSLKRAPAKNSWQRFWHSVFKRIPVSNQL